MDFLFGVAGALFFAVILTILGYIFNFLFGVETKPEESNFMQKVMGIFFVLLVLVIIASISDVLGCKYDDDFVPMRRN